MIFSLILQNLDSAVVPFEHFDLDLFNFAIRLPHSVVRYHMVHIIINDKVDQFLLLDP